MVDRLGGGHVERVPAGVGEAPAEVALVVVDEELGVHVADRGGRLAPDEQGARLRPVDPPGRVSTALHGEQPMQEEGADRGGPDAGEAPGAGDGPASRSRAAARRPPPRVGSFSSASTSAAAAPGRSSESSFRSRQYSPPASRIRVESFSPFPVRRSSDDQADPAAAGPHRVGRAVIGGVVEDEHLAPEPVGVGALDRVEAGEQELAPVRVHDAVGERWRHAVTIFTAGSGE